LIIRMNFQNVVDLDSDDSQCFRLGDGPRESIEQETVPAILQTDTLLDQPNNQLIRNQSTRCHYIFYLETQRGLSLDRCPEHISRGYLRYGKGLCDNFGLRALSGTRRPQQNDPHCDRL